jgi:hypothetical protein
MSKVVKDAKITSSNASSSALGWDFQVNAAIVLMLLNIKQASAVKVEGATEDIEIYLDNEKVIYSQAKAVDDPSDYSNLNKKMQDGLKTLSKASNMPNIDKLIYITNSPNPFNNQKTMYAFSSGLNTYNYAELPAPCKNKIDSIIQQNNFEIKKDELFVYVLQFYGDDQNRYKVIKEKTGEFLNTVGLSDKNLTSTIFDIWHNEFFINASQHDHKVGITKAQMLWPLIVSICTLNQEDALLSNCDSAQFDEIKHKYETLINNHAESFPFITKVISLFNDYMTGEKNTNKRVEFFITNCWKDYEKEFDLSGIDLEIKENIIKITISNVLKSRFTIGRIKKEVNL